METTEEVTTSSIVAQIQARRGGQESAEEDSSKVDNSDESVPVPSISEVASCLDKLRTFFQSKEEGDAFFDAIG